MEEWPDDHLDELFRKSAEEFDAPFNADDWTDLSRRLDKHDRQTLFDRISRWGGIGAILLLLLGGLGWIMYDKKPTGSQQQTISTVLTPARKSAEQLIATSQPQKEVSLRQKNPADKFALRNVPDNHNVEAEPNDKGSATSVRTNAPAGQGTTNTVDNQLATAVSRKASRSAFVDRLAINSPVVSAEHRAGRPGKTSQPPTSKPATEYRTRAFVKKRSQQTGGKPLVDVRSVAENSLARPTAKAATRLSERYSTPMINVPAGNVPGNKSGNQTDLAAGTIGLSATATAEPVADGQWMPALAPAASLSGVVQQVRPVTEPTPPQTTASAPARQAILRLSGLSVMLFASPDLSSIGLKNFDRPGSNAGLAVQYQITDRLSINAGAMYSTKRYQTNASEYVWPDNWAKDIWPEGIAGECKMIDIPLNVRYDWLLRRRGDGRAPARWFASTGLTSYFIKHEVYNYEYANPADPRISYWGWDNQKAGMGGGSFGFSNLNISMGYERPITNRLSWQIEPFMKVPLKQVGYFKIRLLSTGAFVGLRYRF